ncbi:MAG: adenine phosphoribosyltransferase [Actinomycetota bacterium]|nr:adenine phosphoribosyltransferase [Actinomycetota bacterium]
MAPVWAKLVRDVPDFPSPGIMFRDITPVLADADAFATVTSAIADRFVEKQVDLVVGVEARGFILAAPVALRLGAGFIPARKPGKLPWTVKSRAYDLEYGTAALEMHGDAIQPGDSVLIVDDVLATGGTAAAAVALVEDLGGSVAGLGFLLELGFLGGRRQLDGRDVLSLETVR